MNTTLKQELKDKELYIVRSPISGTIDQFSGIYRGSSIQAGQSLAVNQPGFHTVYGNICYSSKYRFYEFGNAGQCTGGII